MAGQRSMQWFWWAAIVLAINALMVGVPAHALDPERRMSQLHLTTWSQRNGVPPSVGVMAQTPDGFLWFGGVTGLYRFDGVRAVPFADGGLLGSATSLATSQNGDLWVGLGGAQIARIREGVLTRFDVPTPGRRGPVYYLAPDPDGTLWVGTLDSVLNFDGRRWRAIASPWPPSASYSQPGGVWGLAVGRDGTVWAKNLLALYYLRRGASAFEAAPGYAGSIIDFARDPQGRLWTADSSSGRFYALPDLGPGRPVPPPTLGAALPPFFFGAVHMDRDGAAWDANRVTGGLYRLASLTRPAALERFTVPQGLLSDAVNNVFEDREGNIWVSTSRGLHRFRPANLVLEPELRMRLQAAQLVATKEAVFLYSGMSAGVGDPNDPGRRLYRIGPNRSVELVDPDVGDVEAMAATVDGGLVLAAGGKLVRWRDGVATPIAMSADVEGGHVNNLVVTPDNVLWVSIHGRGVFRLAAGQWARIGPPSAPREAPSLAVDGAGAVWFMHHGGELAVRVEGGRMTTFRPGVGEFRASYVDREGFIVAGDGGLARFNGHRFETLSASRAPVLSYVFGIAESPGGDLWIGSEAGVIRTTRSALRRALADPEAPFDYQLFDQDDGFKGLSSLDVFNEKLAAGPDGLIWFLTGDHLASVDPDGLHRNAQPPPVVVTAVTAGGRTYSSPRALTLPAGTARLQIDYTALSLAVPERVRFRYRMIGVDKDWIEAGAARQAVYTNVGPGRRRFQVIAANNDGVWNMDGTTLEITIPPTFLQSIWFKFLLALSLAGLAWLAYGLHVRRFSERLQARFDVRVAERERIARELHDTLLQGFQGLLLHFQSAANRAPAKGALRASLNEALDQADAVLIEGRARVRDLRTSSAEGDLAKAVVEAAHRVIEADVPGFRLTVEGAPRDLHAPVCEEATRIAEEAIRNAVHHARASAIDGVLSYGRELRLAIRDDGVGMPPSIVTGGGKSGHFGLVGMRERAESIGGRLDVTSREGSGTEVVLTIPGRAAYKDSRASIFDLQWLVRTVSAT